MHKLEQIIQKLEPKSNGFKGTVGLISSDHPISILSNNVTYITGSRSTFEFSSRVNLSGPSLYCIAQTLGK